MRIFPIFSAFLACLIVSEPSKAHKLNAAESTISFNERTQTIEIVHRFYLHDVNHLIQQHYAKNKTAKVEDKDKYSVFTDYIYSNLKLSINQSDDSIISNLGAESEGKYFFIYQEFKGLTSTNKTNLYVNIEAMKNGWLPDHWLFNQEINSQTTRSVVLNRNILSTDIDL